MKGCASRRCWISAWVSHFSLTLTSHLFPSFLHIVHAVKWEINSRESQEVTLKNRIKKKQKMNLKKKITQPFLIFLNWILSLRTWLKAAHLKNVHLCVYCQFVIRDGDVEWLWMNLITSPVLHCWFGSLSLMNCCGNSLRFVKSLKAVFWRLRESLPPNV